MYMTSSRGRTVKKNNFKQMAGMATKGEVTTREEDMGKDGKSVKSGRSQKVKKDKKNCEKQRKHEKCT